MVSDPLTVSRLWSPRKTTYRRRMLLSCPNCATVYDVSSAVIGENGRSLRCARCQTVWFATRSQALVVAETSTAAVPESARAAAADSRTTPDPSGEAPSSRALVGATSIDHAPPLAPADARQMEPQGAAAASTQGVDIETFARRRAQESTDRASRLRARFGPPTMVAILALIASALVAWRAPIVRHAPQMASFYAAIGLPVNLRELEFRDVKTVTETRDGVQMLTVEGIIASTARVPIEVPRLRFSLRDAAKQEIYAWTAVPEQATLLPGATLSFRSRLASPPSEGQDVIVRFFNKRDLIEGAR